ncbi:unnamed protein product [Kluyveromyces dobzhanskii CBS 2104]|uniref:WGS project CCBQ000000000 data, contig 00058 n=1 Tax=Kluyveromyces dobzhanskii CBS 2104 TaxID=1427455 RepID=A0A0A8LDB9_9SACH|nr:unnamed protein product [Kluyveromyces dobzhanskii CBS 2104]
MNTTHIVDKTSKVEKVRDSDELTSTANQDTSGKHLRNEKNSQNFRSSTPNLDRDFECVFPPKGFRLESVSGELDQNMVMEGRLQLEKELNTVKGQLTQPIYELLHSDSLTKENLIRASDKVTYSTVENKFVLLKRRYYVQDNLLHDVKRKDLVVYEPNGLFDLIMSVHLLNSHASSMVLYSQLSVSFANVTQTFCKLVVSFCSKCNESGNKVTYKKFKHENIHANLVPLGRCHIEIFAPFDTETEEPSRTHPVKIEGKYPYVLYCRDYYSRYVWLEPLKNVSLSALLPVMTKLLFSMVRMPIFIDTCTLDRQDMFDVCENIARLYKIKIGLGMNSSTNFQKGGIKRIKSLFLQNRDACVKDWNMCLKLIVSRVNQNYSDRVRGVPSDLICSGESDLHKKSRTLQRKVISRLMGHHVVQFEEAGGMIYLEDENSSNLLFHGEEAVEDSEEESEVFDNPSSVRDETPLSEPISPLIENTNRSSKNHSSTIQEELSDSRQANRVTDQRSPIVGQTMQNQLNNADMSMEL